MKCTIQGHTTQPSPPACIARPANRSHEERRLGSLILLFILATAKFFQLVKAGRFGPVIKSGSGRAKRGRGYQAYNRRPALRASIQGLLIHTLKLFKRLTAGRTALTQILRLIFTNRHDDFLSYNDVPEKPYVGGKKFD